ncbi:MAG: hypothetical protein WCS69_15470 [Ignavibacteriaceae bacterium]|jgi:hypothetical protein
MKQRTIYYRTPSCTYLVLIFLYNWSLYFALMQAYKKKLLIRYFLNGYSIRMHREVLTNSIKIRAPDEQSAISRNQSAISK